MRPKFSAKACGNADSLPWPLSEAAMPPHISAQCAPPVSPVSNAADSTRKSTGIAGFRLVPARLAVVGQDVERGGVEVLELALAHRPEERRHGQRQQHQGNRNQRQQEVHGFTEWMRRELSVTSSEEPAMPSEA